MDLKKEELIKSPLNYTGGKYKLLPQILPHFPDEIDTFYDLFCGGCDVGINVKANKVVCNDILKQLIELLKYWSVNEYSFLHNEIKNIIKEYNLSDSSTNGYNFYNCNSNDGLSKYNNSQWSKLREDYNVSKSIKLLFPLIIYTFNNNIKFDESGKFVAGGCNKRDYNKNIQNNFKKFIKKISKIDIDFLNSDFKNLYISNNSNNFVYCDPPYLIGKATYNKNWNKEKEKELLEFLDKLNSKGTRFALSNVLESKGKSNDILKDWSKKYKIIHLNNTYGNCNYHTKDKSKNSTDEVLIINY